MVNSAHNLLNPTSISLDEVRWSVKTLRFWEKEICSIDTVSLTLISILCGMCKEAFPQTTITLTISDNLFHIRMTENIFLLICLLIKYIVFHIFVSSFIFFFFAGRVFSYHAGNSIYSSLLFFVKCFEYIGDCFIILIV